MNMVVSIGQAIATIIMNVQFRKIAHWTADMENHKTQKSYNNSVFIKEAFTNIAHATAEDRAAVSNLTDKNRHLASQMAAQANNLMNKDAAMDTTQKIILQLQGELKTLKTKQAGQKTKE